MPKLYELTAQETLQKIHTKEVTAEECVQAVFERIHKLEPIINAYVTLTEEQAIKKAKEIDLKIYEATEDNKAGYQQGNCFFR